MQKVYHRRQPDKVRRFLYSHLPGPLHYTFASFGSSGTSNEAKGLTRAWQTNEGAILNIEIHMGQASDSSLYPEKNFKIKVKRGEKWQPLMRKLSRSS
jgi:hypothetical protein